MGESESCLRYMSSRTSKNMFLPTLKESFPRLSALPLADVKHYAASVICTSNTFTRLFLREGRKNKGFWGAGEETENSLGPIRHPRQSLSGLHLWDSDTSKQI